MSVEVTTAEAEADPVTGALADPSVGERLRNAARAFLGGDAYRQHVDDVVQTVVLRALERRADFDRDRDVVSWLVGFVVNVVREVVRKAGRQPVSLAGPAPALDDLVADLGRPVTEIVADRDFVARLLAGLDPGERELVRLVYTEQLSFAAVAERLGLTEIAARVRHHRVLKHLKTLAGVGEVRS